MTTAHDIDWPQVLAERLTTTHPDVLRELLATFIHTLMGAEADALSAPGMASAAATGPTPAMVIGIANSIPGQAHWISRSPSCARAPISRTGCGAPQTRRTGADHGGRHLLSARGVHPADGQARRDAGHHQPVEVAGVGDGQGTRHRGRDVPTRPLDDGPYTFMAADRPGPHGPRMPTLLGPTSHALIDSASPTRRCGASGRGLSRHRRSGTCRLDRCRLATR